MIKPGNPRPSHGYLAYWRDFADARPFVYERLLDTTTDVGHALLGLERDLQIEITEFEVGSAELATAVAAARTQPLDKTQWVLATRGTIAVTMGFDWLDATDPDALLGDNDGDGLLGLADCKEKSAAGGSMPPPAPPGPSLDDATHGAATGVECCDCGGADCAIVGCEDGECTIVPIPCCNNCDDENPCTDDECVNGLCQHTWACGDSTACIWRTCGPNGCETINVDCNDDNPCTTDSCDDDTGCMHLWQCEDPPSACITRFCGPLGCETITLDCNDENACTNDFCDPEQGCIHDWQCDDPPNACIENWCDTEGGCQTQPRDCDDGDPCTIDNCDPETGCIYAPKCEPTTPCLPEVCDSDGVCHEIFACTDGNECTDDVCLILDPQAGTIQCDYPCRECAACNGGAGVCGTEGACTCQSGGCSVSVASGMRCPGGTIDLAMTADCWADCGQMSFSAVADYPPGHEDLEPWLTFSVPNGVDCVGPSQQITLTVAISAGAPLGPVPIIVTGQPPSGPACTGQATVTVENVVDLDVDSNNDGQITDADDDIEAEPFSPQTPGKRGWINKDDTDGDGNADNGNGIIDGIEDLADIGSLWLRGLAPAQVPPGATLHLETSNAAVLRVFDGVSVFSVPLLGPGLPTTVEIPIDAGNREFGLEGVARGTVLLTLALKDGATVLCADVVRVTVLEITSAVWETSAGLPIDDENPHPPGGPALNDRAGQLGFRLFSGATAPNRPWNDQVQVRVTLNPQVQGVPIHLKLLDPDDPSANNDAVDMDMVGPDNNEGTPGGSLHQTLVQTDAQGQAVAGATVAHSPGDNHRVAATMKQAALDFVTDANVPPSNTDPPTEAQVQFFLGEITPLLTIWRTLHVELDSMRAGKNPTTVVKRNLDQTGIEIDPDHPSHSWAEINGWNNQEQEGRFEGGTLTVINGGTWTIVDNIPDLGDDSIYVEGDITPDEDKLASAVDDDAPFVPRKADISLMNEKYDAAYIRIEEHPEQSDLNIPFVANLSSGGESVAQATLPGRHPPFLTSAEFWFVQIVTCYQGPPEADHDPDKIYHAWSGTDFKQGDPVLFGQTIPHSADHPISYDNVSVIFVESTRDFAAWSTFFGPPPWNLTPVLDAGDIERISVVHEVGHVFGIPGGDDHPSGGIMQADPNDPALEFLPEVLKIFRKSEHIGDP